MGARHEPPANITLRETNSSCTLPLEQLIMRERRPSACFEALGTKIFIARGWCSGNRFLCRHSVRGTTTTPVTPNFSNNALLIRARDVDFLPIYRKRESREQLAAVATHKASALTKVRNLNPENSIYYFSLTNQIYCSKLPLGHKESNSFPRSVCVFVMQINFNDDYSSWNALLSSFIVTKLTFVPIKPTLNQRG